MFVEIKIINPNNHNKEQPLINTFDLLMKSINNILSSKSLIQYQKMH